VAVDAAWPRREGKGGPVALTRRRLASFDSRSNGITAARLVLALTVLVSHSVSLGGFGREPLFEASQRTTSIGFVAVISFFALSGFLLARSRERSSVALFLRNRALRILPAYWIALAFTVLVAVPVAAALRGVAYDLSTAVDWMVPRFLFLPGPADDGVNAAFAGGAVNNSLWTLAIEVSCYLALALTPRRYLRPVVIAELAFATWWLLTPGLAAPGAVLVLAFAAGSAGWAWREWIPLSGRLVAAAVVAAGVALVAGALPLAIVPIAYVALALAWLPIRIERDVSYGVYVLAYPAQQLLVAAGVAALGLPVLLGVTLAVVLPLAYASWTFVEHPVLSLKDRSLRRVPSRSLEPVAAAVSQPA
jgi:peptidoglycan/LPS O-acetylase OafA/YrhL